MRLKSAIFVAMLSAFSVSSMPTVASDEKHTEQLAEVNPARPLAKKSVKPHSHAQEMTGTPSAVPADAQAEPKMPLHDHGKMHK